METDKGVEYTLPDCLSCHFKTFEKDIFLIWVRTHHINNAGEDVEREWCISVCHVSSIECPHGINYTRFVVEAR